MKEPESRERRINKARSAALEELAALTDSVIEDSLLLDRLVRIDENGVVFEAQSLADKKNSPFVAVLPRLSQPRTEQLADIAHSAVVKPQRPAKLPKHLNGFIIPPLPGVTLADVLEERGPLPLGACISISIKLLNAVEAIHAAGLVHGRIRPGAIFVDTTDEDPRTWNIALTDIWLDPDRPPKVAANYRAPEQLRAGGKAKPASDIWAVTVLLLELLHGHPLFEGRSDNEIIRQILLMDPQIPTDSPLLDDEQLQEVLLQALAKKDEQRFTSAAQMAKALTDLNIDSADDENLIEFGPARSFRNTRAEVKKILLESGENPPYAPPGTPGFLLDSSGPAGSLKGEDADALLDLLSEKDKETVSKRASREPPMEIGSADEDNDLKPDEDKPDEEEKIDSMPPETESDTDFEEDDIEDLLSGIEAIPPEINEAAVIDTDPKTTQLDPAVTAEALMSQRTVTDHDDSETLQVGSLAFNDMANFMAAPSQTDEIPQFDDEDELSEAEKQIEEPADEKDGDDENEAPSSSSDAPPTKAPGDPGFQTSVAPPPWMDLRKKKVILAAGVGALLLLLVALAYSFIGEDSPEDTEAAEETSLEQAAGVGVKSAPPATPPALAVDTGTEADTTATFAAETATDGDAATGVIDHDSVAISDREKDSGASSDSTETAAEEEAQKAAEPPPVAEKAAKKQKKERRLDREKKKKRSKKHRRSHKKRAKKKKKKKSKVLANNPFGG